MDSNINIRIFDRNINFLGEVDDFTSLFYIRKWETYGEFEFHIPKIDRTLIKKGNIIMLNKDGNRTGVIEHIEISEENTEDITIKGFSLLYWLTQRITIPSVGHDNHSFNCNVEDIMIGLVKSNAVDPVEVNRKIPKLIVDTSKNRGDKIQFQTRYKSLIDELIKLSKGSGLGFSIDLDYKNKKFVFRVLQGRDLTYGQGVNPPAIFSKDYDNITKQNYVESNVGYKNVGYVVGKGEGTFKQIEIISNELSGLDRRETFIEASDIEDGGSLIDRGKLKLSEYHQIQSWECEVDTKEYKKSWDLGDVVTTLNKKMSLRVDNRVVEIREVYEKNDFKVEPTFGSPIPTLGEKIKQMTDSPSIASSGGGGYDKSYTFNQISSKEVWKIAHGLDKYPSVTVVDSGGNEVIGDIKYVDSNNVELRFIGGFSGVAYLN